MNKLCESINRYVARDDSESLKKCFSFFLESSLDELNGNTAECFADAFFYLNLFSEAVECYFLLVSKKGNNEKWLYRLSHCYFRLKMIDEAIHFLTILLELFPDHLQGRIKLSKCYLVLGDGLSALSVVDYNMDAVNPKEADLAAQKAFSFKFLRMFDDAILSFKNALQVQGLKSSKKAFWCFSLAKCYKETSYYDHAIFYFLEALSLGEKRVDLYIELAQLLFNKNNYEKCIDIASLVDGKLSNNYHYLSLIADSQRLLGQPEAVNSYQVAIQKGCAELSPASYSYLVDQAVVSERDPVGLLCFKRFDIYVKILYAEFFFKKWLNSSLDFESLYLRHVYLRTKGVEPFSKEKNDLKKYLSDFKLLIKSISRKGYDSCFPVPIANDERIVNGAHRLAASLVLNLKSLSVIEIQRDRGIDWGFDWFLNKGFVRDELNEILLCWLRYNSHKAKIVVLWPSVEQVWDDITEEMRNDVNIVTCLDYSFTELGLSELVKDVYSIDSVGDFMPNICNKAVFLSSYSPKVRVLYIEDDSDCLLNVKSRVRDKYDYLISRNLFSTIHASDCFSEAVHLASIFLHQPTLDLINSRKSPLNVSLCKWIKEAKESFSSKKVLHSELCAVGGAVLDAYGVRSADDLDITVSSNVRKKYFSAMPSPLSENVDIVRRGYSKDVGQSILDDQLVFDRAYHVYVRGFKFANLEVVRKRKMFSQREKDLKDLAKISRFSWS
ncbi:MULTISPECIES: tetratricopeptide repeat protein [unclassified Halomonas]|uniref:tetratricopeptide repeat protein n=1 Tax=unclassified Halomonas TaxID=2609666 RepID=UPI004034C437